MTTATAHGFDSGTINGAWQTRGNCRDADPETMWPHNKSGITVERGRRVCLGCPVRIDCLEDGIDAQEWESIRGGLTGGERESYHRDGMTVDQYPAYREPASIKWCQECGKAFAHNPRHPFAEICQFCKLKRRRAEKRTAGYGSANLVKTHCRNGHLFDEDNTYVDREGRRQCRTCRRARERARWRSRKADVS